MSKTIKVALAGAGAFGIKHLDGIKNIEGVEVVSLVSRELEKTKEVAAKYGIGHVTTHLDDSLALGRHPQRSQRRGSDGEKQRLGGHVRPHTPLQPQPPICAQANPSW